MCQNILRATHFPTIALICFIKIASRRGSAAFRPGGSDFCVVLWKKHITRNTFSDCSTHRFRRSRFSSRFRRFPPWWLRLLRVAPTSLCRVVYKHILRATQFPTVALIVGVEITSRRGSATFRPGAPISLCSTVCKNILRATQFPTVALIVFVETAPRRGSAAFRPGGSNFLGTRRLLGDAERTTLSNCSTHRLPESLLVEVPPRSAWAAPTSPSRVV